MKIRVISAIVLIAILVPFLYFGGIPFAIIMSIIGFLGYKEILDLKKSHGKIPTIIKGFGLLALANLFVGDYNNSILIGNLDIKKVLLPIVLLLLPTVFYDKKTYTTKDALFLITSIIVLGLFFNSIICIRNYNVFLLLYLLSIAIFSDTFAFIIGMMIGKHKMSKLSPNKSWEGFFGGLIFGTIFSTIVYNAFVSTANIKVVAVTMLLSVVGQMGDLFFSKMKRENDIKDFSNIVPGHGGILDRIDSLLFIVLTYVLLIGVI